MFPSGLGASSGTEGPYLLMPLGVNPLLGSVPLYPAFPLYAMTPFNSNTSLSAFDADPPSNFSTTHVIMSSPIVNLTVDVAQALQVNM